MLLGKRQRPPINRTTSLSEIKFDLNTPIEPEVSNQQSSCQDRIMEPHGRDVAAVDEERELLDQRFLSMVVPRSNMRRHSGEFCDGGHFLKSCSLCERLLVPGRDIYMYRGDTAFCSLECRQEQMTQDEGKEKGKSSSSSSSSAKEPAVAATAKPGKGIRSRAAAAV